MTRRGMAALVVVSLVMVACGSSTPAGPPKAASPYLGTYVAVCRAAEAAKKGDGERAKRIYLDSAHLNLVDLANTVLKTDRHLTGRVLIQHGLIESDLRAGASSAVLHAHLAGLGDATRDVIDASGSQKPPSCDKEIG